MPTELGFSIIESHGGQFSIIHLTGGKCLKTQKIGSEASTDTNRGWRNSFQLKVSIHSAKQNVAMISIVTDRNAEEISTAFFWPSY